jgi:putative membrane protein
MRARKNLATIEIEKDSTSNIARRYSYLFRLPSVELAILYASIPTLTIEFLTRTILGASLTRILLYAAATEILLVFAIEIDYLVLKKSSGIATFRRITAIAILSNAVWLTIAIIGYAVFFVTKSEGRFFSLIIVGAFFAISFRALIFGSVFYKSPFAGLPLAAVQPVILILPVALSLKAVSLYSGNTIAALVGGIVAIVGIETYLYAINKPRISEELRALPLLQAFLNAWTIEDPVDLEGFFDLVSTEQEVNTTMIRLESSETTEKNTAAQLIVPGVHPGPFYPIGSSNLPGDLYKALRTPTSIPLVVHSISDHELNLATKSEVDLYVKTLFTAKELDQGSVMTAPIVKSFNKATVSGFALGRTLVIAATQAPYGMEDLPARIREEIDAEASKNGFTTSFVIDAHNSLGAKPNKEETIDIIRAAIQVIEELSGASQQMFRFGFAHSSEIPWKLAGDIGPAGIGFLYFEGENFPGFCLVIVDANNAKLGFRGKVFEDFTRKTGAKLLEICTSDTHVTAARTFESKGYLALGDLTSPEQFSNLMRALYEKARSRLSDGRFSTSAVASRVKTIGGEIMNDFSGLLDETSLIAKRGALALAIVAIVVTTLVALA